MRTTALALALSTAISLAQDTAVKPLPEPAAATEKEQGICLTLTSNGKTDIRPARLVALHVAKGQPVSSFFPAGPFTAKWEGELESPLRADYKFNVAVTGEVKISINDKPVLEAKGTSATAETEKAVRLNKGANMVVVEFSCDGGSEAELRLNWSSKSFPSEPIAPTNWKHTPSSPELASVRLHQGRALLARSYCVQCHDPAGVSSADGSGMMDLLATPPDLADAGARFKPDWIAAWAENPRKLRANARMPHLPITHEQAGDVAAYLATLGKPTSAPVGSEKVAAGGALFASLGCVACHTTPDFSGEDQFSRTSLSHIRAKFQPAALKEYLQIPSMHNPWSRMPNFRLSDEETDALSQYLLAKGSAELPAVSGDAKKGAETFASVGCANCHAVPGVVSSLKPKSLRETLKSEWQSGCLAKDATSRGKAPDFAFTADEHDSLVAFAATGLEALKSDNPIGFAERQIRNMNCTACHSRDGRQSTWSLVESEMAPLLAAAPAPATTPDSNHKDSTPISGTWVPALTWLGEKLLPGWMGSFIAGAAPNKPRPWIQARMPGFGAPGVGIANGLALQHGFALEEKPAPPVDLEKAKIGEKLLGPNGGFNCTTCHGVKDLAPTAVFEAPGINLGYAIDRLRPGYFQRWLLAPSRIDPETKMPKFSEDGISTGLSDVCEGNAAAQFDAIWQYLRSISAK